MRYTVKLNNIPQTLEVTLFSGKFIDVEIYAKHPTFEQTAITSRVIRFKGQRNVMVIIPIPLESVEIVARDARTRDDRAVKIQNIVRKRLETNIEPITHLKSPLLAEFIKHCLDFCLRASFAPTGDYNSISGRIKIKYENKLKAKDKEGRVREITSPARIDGTNGQIEIAKDFFKNYTVCGRFAILCHEFSHVYLNKDMRNEQEADKNASTIYLGLGFPRTDLLVTWVKVFRNADTESNRERMEKYVNAAKSINIS